MYRILLTSIFGYHFADVIRKAAYLVTCNFIKIVRIRRRVCSRGGPSQAGHSAPTQDLDKHGSAPPSRYIAEKPSQVF